MNEANRRRFWILVDTWICDSLLARCVWQSFFLQNKKIYFFTRKLVYSTSKR